MPKRKLAPEADANLRKALKVRGASERAVCEIWNLTQPEENRVSRGFFEAEVADELSPWKECLRPVTLEGLSIPTFDVPVVDIKDVILKICDRSTAFCHALERALETNPVLTPVFYYDDCIAGNILSVEKQRKCSMFYMSWLEGWHHAKHSSFWIPVCAVQTVFLAKTMGGASQLMIHIVKQLLTSDTLRGFQVTERIFFKQKKEAWFLGDADAIRAIYSAKGSAGLRPCLLCKNVLKLNSGLVEHDDYFIEINASAGFKLNTDQEIFQVADRMNHCRTKSQLEAMEKCSGITYNSASLLFDQEARDSLPPSRCMSDVLHSYFVNGVCSWEIALILEQLYKHTRVTRELLQSSGLGGKWHSLKASGKTQNYVKALFDERIFGEGLFKGEGHQTRSILPLLRYYFEVHIEPCGQFPQKFLRSFKCLCRCVDIISEISHSLQGVDRAAVQRLDELQRKHQDLFLAYEVDHKPKHHHRLHLPSQWLQAGVYLSCEPMESKHRLYKSGIGDRQRHLVRKPGEFASAVMVRLLQACVQNLNQYGLPFWELQGPIQDASMDDKILMAALDLKTSKSYLSFSLHSFLF
eukprot:Skav236711  [mRNA]  locus=scaffold738:453376:455118:+ [translate_table: standard]